MSQPTRLASLLSFGQEVCFRLRRVFLRVESVRVGSPQAGLFPDYKKFPEEPMKGERRRSSLVRMCIATGLCLCIFALPAQSQGIYPSGPIGPLSNGQITAILVGIAAVLIITPIVIVHEVHKHHRIAGCVSSENEVLTVTDKQGRKYSLSGDSSSVRAGEQVMLTGKKIKASGGTPAFRVDRVVKDYGACKP